MLFETIDVVSQRLASGSVTSVELSERVLAASRDANRLIGAYSEILERSAIEEAAASDHRRRTGTSLGPLDGIPIAIKDLIDTHPAVCKAGLDHLAGYVPPVDAQVVAALRRAGAVIVGVTETDPGAFSTDTPQSINPLAPNRTVGGSSGGSAAAVAAGLAFASLGTDTGGSIRIPAACCSISGFKPTWGRINAAGVRPLAPSLDHVGPLARSVGDLALMQSVLDPGSPGTESEWRGNFTLGTDETYFNDASEEVAASVLDTMQKLLSYGGATHHVSLPAPDDVLAFHMVNLPKEAADYHLAHFPDAWPMYPEIARTTVDAGSRISDEEYERAERHRRESIAQVDRALETVDALLLPTLPVDAPFRDSETMALRHRTMTKLEITIRYTALFNQTGHPVISMPATIIPGGRALSFQLVGKRNADAALLRLGKRIERLLSAKVDYATIVKRQANNAKRVRAELTEE